MGFSLQSSVLGGLRLKGLNPEPQKTPKPKDPGPDHRHQLLQPNHSLCRSLRADPAALRGAMPVAGALLMVLRVHLGFRV